MVTSRWKEARKEIYGFADRLNTELTCKNDFDKDFIMKSCLVLTDLSVKYKVENFNNKNLGLIEQNWKKIRNAIERGVDLSNCFGIDKESLTSKNALIPIIYYLYNQPKQTLHGTTPFDMKNSSNIRKWLLMALLNNVFGGSSDTMLQTIRESLQEHGKEGEDFPLEAINTAIKKKGQSTAFDQNNVDRILSLTYHESESFLALSLLFDENRWGTLTYDMDHIFPRSAFQTKNLKASGIDESKFEIYRDYEHSLANLTLLLRSWQKTENAKALTMA